MQTKLSYYELKQLIGAQQQLNHALRVKKNGYFVQQRAMNAVQAMMLKLSQIQIQEQS